MKLGCREFVRRKEYARLFALNKDRAAFWCFHIQAARQDSGGTEVLVRQQYIRLFIRNHIVPIEPRFSHHHGRADFGHLVRRVLRTLLQRQHRPHERVDANSQQRASTQSRVADGVSGQVCGEVEGEIRGDAVDLAEDAVGVEDVPDCFYDGEVARPEGFGEEEVFGAS